jgi:hypothetical protein
MSLNEWGIVVAAIGVVVGVVLEGGEHWHDFKTKGWKPVTPKIGFAVLVISLAVEIVFDGRVAKESADTRLEAAKIEAANVQLEKRMHGFVHKNEGLGGLD